jgi:hypothetical protein
MLTGICHAVAAVYIQALTAFSLALVLNGGAALFDLMPLEQQHVAWARQLGF